MARTREDLHNKSRVPPDRSKPPEHIFVKTASPAMMSTHTISMESASKVHVANLETGGVIMGLPSGFTPPEAGVRGK